MIRLETMVHLSSSVSPMALSDLDRMGLNMGGLISIISRLTYVGARHWTIFCVMMEG
jgi:hypothetical protein